MKRLMIILALFLLINTSAETKTYKGKVSKVSSGDTFYLKTSKKTYKVRLMNTDAPDTGQEYSKEAKAALSKLVLDKEVNVQVYKTSKSKVYALVLASGKNVNEYMISWGHTWYRESIEGYSEWKGMMEIAKKKRLGLWADKNAISPWDFRDGKTAKKDDDDEEDDEKESKTTSSSKYDKEKVKELAKLKYAYLRAQSAFRKAERGVATVDKTLKVAKRKVERYNKDLKHNQEQYERANERVDREDDKGRIRTERRDPGAAERYKRKIESSKKKLAAAETDLAKVEDKMEEAKAEMEEKSGEAKEAKDAHDSLRKEIYNK